MIDLRRSIAWILLSACVVVPSQVQAQASADSVLHPLPEGEFVLLRPDSVLTGSVTVNSQTFGQDSIIVDDSLRVVRDRARAYRTEGGTYRRGPDEDWVQLAAGGPIDRWTKREERPTMIVTQGSDGQVHHQMGMPQQVSYDYFSVEGGPVQEMEPDALRPVVRDVPESRRYVNQYETLGKVQLGLGLTGLAIVVGSLVTLDKGDDVPSGLFIGGAVAATSWIPYFARQPKLEQAIDVYNREKRPAPESSASPENGSDFR